MIFFYIPKLPSPPVSSKGLLPKLVFFINASPIPAQSNPVLSTFLGILSTNCSQAVATLLVFGAGYSEPRVDLALEEAGLTPGSC